MVTRSTISPSASCGADSASARAAVLHHSSDAAEDFVWVIVRTHRWPSGSQQGRSPRPGHTQHGLSGAIAYPGVYPDTKPPCIGIFFQSARVAAW